MVQNEVKDSGKIAEIPLLLTQRRAPPGTLPEARISGKPQPHTPPKCRWPHPAAPRTAFPLPGGLFAMSAIVRGGGTSGALIWPKLASFGSMGTTRAIGANGRTTAARYTRLHARSIGPM